MISHASGHLMTVEDATNIIVGACRALHYVHSKGYVHADICTVKVVAFTNPKNVSHRNQPVNL